MDLADIADAVDVDVRAGIRTSLVPDLLSGTKENPVTCGRERIELLPPINRADSTQMVQFFSGGDCKSPPSSG